MNKIVLDSVDRYRVVDPMFESVRVVLASRGEAYTPAYIQGISGAAFRIGGICPCAPTSEVTMDTQDLVTRLGYEMTYLPLYQKGEAEASFDIEAEAEDVIASVKDEIRAGRPLSSGTPSRPRSGTSSPGSMTTSIFSTDADPMPGPMHTHRPIKAA